MKNQGDAPEKGRLISSAVFWLAAAGVLLYGLGIDHLRGSEERWAEIAREMLITGDWFHPAINGQIYFDKPLLSYWPIAGLALLLGRLDECVIRLPGALAGLAALWCVIRLGKRLFSEQVGRAAGWIMLSAFGFITVARMASADMMNMTAVIMAVLWFFHCKDRAGFRHYLVFYLICFGGALTKGLPALVIPPLLVLIHVIMDNTWRKHVTAGHALAFAAGLALFCLPFYIAATTAIPPGFLHQASGLTGLELVWRENVVRVFEPFDHVEPFYVYLIHMPRIMAPWAILFYAAPAAMIARWRGLPLNARWLLAANAVILLMFSFSGSRRWYYIMPMVPFTALMIGCYFAGGMDFPWRRTVARLHTVLFFVVCAACLAAPFAVWLSPRVPALGRLAEVSRFPAVILCAMPAAAIIAIAVLLSRSAVARLTALPEAWAATILAATILLGAALAVVFPHVGALRQEKPFALALRETLRDVPADDVAFFFAANPKVIFYMDFPPPPRELRTPEEVAAFVADGAGPKYLVIEDRWGYPERMAEAAPGFASGEAVLSEGRYPFERPNRNKLHCLRLLPALAE